MFFHISIKKLKQFVVEYYDDELSLQKEYFNHNNGDLAFVSGSEIMYMKTSRGWVPVQVGKPLPYPGSDVSF